MQKLLELPTNKLLDKLGAGNHIPGSGSAAALNGIIACKLLSTVIQLTLSPKRKGKYKHCKSKCIKIKEELEKRICPRLEKLFQDDSNQFDKVINKRRQRDAEQNQLLKIDLQRQTQKEMITATSIPFEIANLSLNIAEYSIYIFDNGFKSARGDTSVALFNSIASIAGCLSIINLNVQSIRNHEMVKRIAKAKTKIEHSFDLVKELSIERLDILSGEAKSKRLFYAGLDKIRNRLHNRLIITYKEIEKLTKDIQNFLWKNRNLIWKNNEITHPLDVLNPQVVIKLLKYNYKEVNSLGVTDSNQELAGVIDNERKEIIISRKFKREIVNFTASHELGHALMHNDLKLHRDLPLESPFFTNRRPKKELQADKFAVYFLMPEKLIREVFKEIFYLEYLEINNTTSIALANCSPSQLKRKFKSVRDFSRFVANLNFYNVQPITPISNIFRVSTEAMAIRLEELDLVRL